MAGGFFETLRPSFSKKRGMRIAVYHYKKNGSTVSMRQIKKYFKRYIEPNFGDFVIVDFFEDMDTLEYCASVRSYDLVAVNSEWERKSCFKDLVNVLGSLKKTEISTTLLIMTSSGILDITALENYAKSMSPNVKIKTLCGIKDIEDMVKALSDAIYGIIDEMSKSRERGVYIKKIDFVTKEVLFEDAKTGDLYHLKLNRAMDVNMLLTFLKFGTDRKIPLSYIISSVLKEPETGSISPLEASMSSIRKAFMNAFGINPINSGGRQCYLFSLRGR